VKLQKHLNHIAAKAEIRKNGRIYFPRKAINTEGTSLMSKRNGRKAKFSMKTKFILVCLVILCGFAAFLISCSKDDEGSQSCTCMESDGAGYSASRVVTPSSFGAANCQDLELKLSVASSGDFDYSCR
jgi:hypothetical protein